MTSNDLAFDDMGAMDLKGVAESVKLFRARAASAPR